MTKLLIGVASLLIIPIALAAALLARTDTQQSLAHAPSGAIFTTVEDGSFVNANIYQNKNDVYLDGGPPLNAPSTAAGLDPGNYYFQVTDPSGKVLLSQDPVKCREFVVNSAGVISAVVPATHPNPNKQCEHSTGIDGDHAADGAITVQLMPYQNTPNNGGVYKVWATFVEDFQGDPKRVDNPCSQGCFHGFIPAHSKTDNYKVRGRTIPPRITVLKWYDYDQDGVEEVGTVDHEVFLPGWKVSIKDPLGTTTYGYTPVIIDPADEGEYEICELDPNESGWFATADKCFVIEVANEDDVVVEFGNVYRMPFQGGLTIGYWKTHSSLGPAGPRDATFDELPIVLGVPSNGISAPEVNVTTEAIAVDVLTTASEGCSGDCLVQLKAQLLGAKLNCLAFDGFCSATLGLPGPTVQSIIDAADELLDDVANGVITGEAAIKAIAEPLKTQLDSANNNGHTPVLWVVSPIPGPYTF